MKKYFLLTSIIMVSLTFFDPAQAQEERKLPRPPVESSGSIIINWQMLGLNSNQTQKIRNLRIDFQKLSIRLSAESDLKQLEIEKLLISPTSDPDEIRKLMREKLEIDAKLRMAALENFISIKSLLTSEQLAKLPRATTLR